MKELEATLTFLIDMIRKIHIFKKNECNNIDKDEEEDLKKLAAHPLLLAPLSLGKAQCAGELMGVNCDAQEKISYS